MRYIKCVMCGKETPLEASEEFGLCRYCGSLVMAADGDFSGQVGHPAVVYEQGRDSVTSQRIYNQAIAKMNNGTAESYFRAAALFRSIPGYKDADTLCNVCANRATDIRKQQAAEEEKKRRAIMKRRRRLAAIITLLLCNLLAIALVVIFLVVPKKRYQKAEELLDQGRTAEAAIMFSELNYMDAKERGRKLWDDIAVRQTVAVGCNHVLSLTHDNSVQIAYNTDFFDVNYYGSESNSHYRNWENVIAIDAGDNSTAVLFADGTVDYTYGMIHEWENIVAISAGSYFCVGLQADGKVVATDGYDVGEWSDIVAISAGGSHIVGLKADGTVVATGDNNWGQCQVEGWDDIVAIAAGKEHTVGLKADGTVVAVGYEGYEGRCEVNDWTDIVAIAAGEEHTVGLKADGTVVVTNDGYSRKVADWKDIVAIVAYDDYTIGLQSDGSLLYDGRELPGYNMINNWDTIKVK